MPVGAYSVAFNEALWVTTGTTASSAPTSTSGLTRLTSISEASLSGSSETTGQVIDFDADLGFGAQLIKSASYEIPMVLNVDPGSAGYRLLKSAWALGPSGTLLRWLRQSPKVGGTANTAGELNRGLGFIQGFSEQRKAGEVITVTFTLAGYGQPFYHYQGNPLATVTVTTNGSGMTPATYTSVPLINVTDGSGINAIATIVVAGGGTVTAAPTITTPGTNYKVGDILTVASGALGGVGVLPTFTVATITT